MTIEELEQTGIVQVVDEAAFKLSEKFPNVHVQAGMCLFIARKMIILAKRTFESESSQPGATYDSCLNNKTHPMTVDRMATCAGMLVEFAEALLRCEDILLDEDAWVDVQSSNLKRVKYFMDTLYVEFHSGAIYRYHEVPAYVYEALLKADSIGKFFNKIIKKGDYPWALVKQSSPKLES